MTNRVHSPRRAALLFLVVGLVMIGTYFLLRAHQVGKIGQPTDIGGGGILLLGFAVTIGGLAWVISDLLRGRS